VIPTSGIRFAIKELVFNSNFVSFSFLLTKKKKRIAKMKKILAFCFLFGVVSAQQFPSAINIQSDIDTTFEKYYQFALKFVDKIGDELDKRVTTYVSAHQRLVDQFRNVRNITNITINAEGEKIISEVLTFIDGLVIDYRKTLDRSIFVRTLDKYMSTLRSEYVKRVGESVNELMKWISKLPLVQQCWNESRADIENVVRNGFVSAQDAAILALSNANLTLNINEFLVSSTIDSNNLFISSCRGNPDFLNSCISSFLTVASISIPANINYWSMTTENAVKTNLALAETLFTASANSAYGNIVPIASRIETCVRGFLG
jgi:hypothetical protein